LIATAHRNLMHSTPCTSS